MFAKEKSPFDVDLRCNINIEVNVAMRLGELIKASGTEDKQLLALGYRLSNAMRYLADNLDDRQWEKFSSYMEEQSSDLNDEGDYSSRARESVGEMPKNISDEDFQDRPLRSAPRTLRSIVRSVTSRE